MRRMMSLTAGVKKPEESKYPGDFYKLRATIPADEAFRPLKEAIVHS